MLLITLVSGMFVAPVSQARQSTIHSDAKTTDGPVRFARWMVSDARALTSTILTPDPRLVAGTGALLIPTMLADPYVNGGVRRASGRQIESWLDATNRLTGSRARLPLIGVFGASLVSGHDTFQDAAFTSIQSWLYAGVMHRAVKGLVGRARPNVSPEGTRFEPFSEHRSFPSGHTTDAFAIVTPWILYADTPAAYALFAVPAGTAIARLEKEKHFLTDVLAGAAIGIGTSIFLVRRHRTDRSTRKTHVDHGQKPEAGNSARIHADLIILASGARLTLRF